MFFICFQVTPKSVGLNPNAHEFKSKSPNTIDGDSPSAISLESSNSVKPVDSVIKTSENTTLLLQEMPGTFTGCICKVYEILQFFSGL